MQNGENPSPPKYLLFDDLRHLVHIDTVLNYIYYRLIGTALVLCNSTKQVHSLKEM